MPITPGVWGIDLGQCALKAIRLQEVDGELTATAFDYVEHPKILSQPDADPDQLTREALEKFLSRNTLRGDIVSISVPGQSGLARFVKLPPVEEKKIADIVRFEAKQQIPFNLDEVIWDYQRIGSSEPNEGGFAMGIEIGLFAMKRDMIGRYLQHFKEVGVEIHHVQMAPLALCNFVSYDMLGKGARVKGEESEKANCVVALDIGADSSNLVITDADRVIWQRPIPLGGNHFTRALTKELKLTFAKAEHLKRNAMKSPDLKKILTALKPVLNDFVGEVQRSLGYFTNTHRDAQIGYMVGLGNAFRLPGLQRYLGEKLQLEVKKLSKMERLSGEAVLTQPAFSENIMTFGVAYGLALQGLKQARLLTNLLPPEIRVERLVRAKKPWAVAVAALLLVGTSAMAFKAYRESRVYLNPDVATAIKKAEDATKAVAEWDSKFGAAQKAANDEKDAINSLVAGQPEFKNWLELTTFVSKALPLPDGTNLSEVSPGGREVSPKQRYWIDTPAPQGHPPNPMSGSKSFEEYKKRLLAGGGKPDTGKDDLGVGIDDLVQINVTSFDARFCDDLGVYWDAARQVSKDTESVRPLENGKPPAPPTGKGWIVELKGYTFHYRQDTFIRETLLQNIADNSIIKETTPEPGAKDAPLAPGGAKDAPLAPGGAPPAPGGAPPAPGGAKAPMGTDAEDKEIPPTGPVKNRISHVLFLRQFTTPFKMTTGPSDLPPFQILEDGTYSVTELSKGVTAALGGRMGMGMSGPPGGAGGPGVGKDGPGGPGGAPVPSLRDTWAPLGTGIAPQGGQGSGMMPRTPMRTPTAKAPLEGRTPGSPPPADVEKLPQHKRTEFVILFIWREPTPSLKHRMEEGDPNAAPPTLPGAPGPGGGAAPPPPPAGGGGSLRDL